MRFNGVFQMLAYIGFLQLSGKTEGKIITCACSTHDCQLVRNVSTCTTNSLCFTQFLDRQDGSGTIIRGCIDTRTPLLCENKRPAVPGYKWPVLLCCNSSMCNRKATPTIPPWYHTDNITISSMGIEVTVKSVNRNNSSVISTLPYFYSGNEVENSISNNKQRLNSQTNDMSEDTIDDSTRYKIISPVYITVLVVGVVLLVVIGVVAACILRKQKQHQQQQRLYTRHWITVDHEAAGYFKRQQCLSPTSEINLVKPDSGVKLVNVSTDEDDDDNECTRKMENNYPTTFLLLHPAFAANNINANAANVITNSYLT
ncbi:hypothetical protein CHUAL_008383 [Chamberlinius hualienensis]